MPSPFYNIPDPTYQRCLQIFDNAFNAWHDLIRTIAAENIAMGITQQNKTKYIADILMPVMLYGQTGSLWEAYHALDAIKITPDMAPFITEDRRAWMKNQLIQIISSL
jgi:hypothetical protein